MVQHFKYFFISYLVIGLKNILLFIFLIAFKKVNILEDGLNLFDILVPIVYRDKKECNSFAILILSVLEFIFVYLEL